MSEGHREHGVAIGVDLGGTKIEAVVIEPGGAGFRELARARVPTAREKGYDHILASTAALVRDVAKQAGVGDGALPTIGVGMPGSTTRAGLVKNSNTTCLNGRPFRQDLARAIGRSVAFANDANCFALAEATWGAARGARMTFGVILGTGVGGGVVFRDGAAAAVDGTHAHATAHTHATAHAQAHAHAHDSAGTHVRARARAWDGAMGIAGDWGHVVLDPVGGRPCYCGRRGCIETYLCGPAIEAAYAERAGTKKPLAEIAASLDPVARALLAERFDVFGRALATLIDVLDPDVIVLGGGVSNVAALYDEGIRAVERWVFSDELTTRIVKNELGDSAGVLGAALLPEPST